MSTDIFTTRSVPAAAPSPEGIGDIVLAGRSSGYAHLSATAARPTVGRLASAVRGAARALADPALWPTRRGRWQRPPRAVRRRAPGRVRVSVVVLAPNEFVALPAARPAGGVVLHLVRGRVHAVLTSRFGRLRAVQELVENRTRVLGDSGGRQLVNTGTGPAVLVRVTA